MRTSNTRFNHARLQHALNWAIVIGAIALPLAAMASSGGTGGDELADGYNWFKGIVTGYGGKLLALALLFVAGWAGLFKGSLTGAALSIGMAMCLIWVPKVIETMFSATLPAATVAMTTERIPASAQTHTVATRVDFSALPRFATH